MPDFCTRLNLVLLLHLFYFCQSNPFQNVNVLHPMIVWIFEKKLSSDKVYVFTVVSNVYWFWKKNEQKNEFWIQNLSIHGLARFNDDMGC